MSDDVIEGRKAIAWELSRLWHVEVSQAGVIRYEHRKRDPLVLTGTVYERRSITVVRLRAWAARNSQHGHVGRKCDAA